MNKAIKFVSMGLFASILLCAMSFSLNANEPEKEHIKKKYTIFFPAGISEIETDYKDNRHTITTLIDDLKTTMEVDGSLPGTYTIVASTSPEGTLELNQRLAMQRAYNTREILTQNFPELKPQQIKLVRQANDWSGMVLTIRRDTTFQYRDQLLQILTDPNIRNLDAHIRTQHPHIYDSIKDSLFDNMRTSSITIEVVRTEDNIDEYIAEPFKTEDSAAEIIDEPIIPDEQKSSYEYEKVEETNTTIEVSKKKSLLIGVKNNLLYDLAATPNIGLEFYLGKNWSIAGNWMYAWWHSDPDLLYWRTYGGDLAIRKWFGKASKKKALTGHHVGIYGQMLTYDFLMDEDGILADKWNWAAGLEYGYSVPLARRLNMDFTLGAGYHWGEFKEYIPMDGHYVWQATKKRRFIGPTKIEISLVWLIGGSDKLPAKGGKR